MNTVLKIRRFCSIPVLGLFLTMPNGCDLFQISLVDYLEDGGGDAPSSAYVYVAVSSGNDGNSGRTRGDPVKTIGRALDIWEAKLSAGANIMFLEDVPSSHGEATGSGLIDLSALLSSRPGISTLTLAGSGSGKTIDNGTVLGRSGLYINIQGKTITLQNLTITGGRGNPGGGIYINGSTVTVQAGVRISGNETGTLGGAVHVDGINSHFYMTGGTISGNKAIAPMGQGGAVYVGINGDFTMKGGTIRDNEASTGGGIAIGGGGTMFFHDGTVRDNRGLSLGGGICIVQGTLDMQGGTVRGNTAAAGPGIVVESAGTVKMSGDARMLDPANPVYLYGVNRMIFIGDFTGNYTAGIAVVTTNGYPPGGVAPIIFGSTLQLTAYHPFFNVDGHGFGSSLDNNGRLL
ncbi:MAG: hypothetical protein LBO65_00600 [Spirochaetaceae bacterium]|jgi:hypothetical protein|nr:hypothetical protein [Spirochaetaceae bacterium]